MQIIDSQVHIWAENTPERPWAPNMEGRAHLPEPLTAERLLGMMNEAGVDAAILVPPSLEGDRNDLALAAARKYRRPVRRDGPHRPRQAGRARRAGEPGGISPACSACA